MNIIEEALAFEEALKKKSVTSVARKANKSVRYVTNHRVLARLPDDLREDVVNGKIGLPAARMIAKRCNTPEQMRNLVTRLRESGVNLRRASAKLVEAYLPAVISTSLEGMADAFLSQTYQFAGSFDAFVGMVERCGNDLSRAHKRAIVANLVRIAEVSLRLEGLGWADS